MIVGPDILFGLAGPGRRGAGWNSCGRGTSNMSARQGAGRVATERFHVSATCCPTLMVATLDRCLAGFIIQPAISLTAGLRSISWASGCGPGASPGRESTRQGAKENCAGPWLGFSRAFLTFADLMLVAAGLSFFEGVRDAVRPAKALFMSAVLDVRDLSVEFRGQDGATTGRVRGLSISDRPRRDRRPWSAKAEVGQVGDGCCR